MRYGESPALLGLLKQQGPQRWLMRKLQRYSVNLGRWQFQKLLADGEFAELQPGMYAQANDILYHPTLGLLADRENPAADSLVI